MIIKIITEGGSMKPNPALAQRMGPLGINVGKIISDVNGATKKFAGMKIPVRLDINTKTKEIKVEVLQPSTAELLKKEFSALKGSGQPQKFKIANSSIEQIIKIAKEKQCLEKSLKSSVKTIVGACQSLGILIENKEPQEILGDIDSGVYDKTIEQQKTVPSSEKVNELNEFFDKIKKTQEALMKKEEEEKAKEEAEKAAKAATAGAVAPAAAAKAVVPTEEKKAEAKPAVAAKK